MSITKKATEKYVAQLDEDEMLVRYIEASEPCMGRIVDEVGCPVSASNAPSEIDLLRAVASAAKWAIESNGDDPVGRDGRARVGLNWVAANGALNLALKDLAAYYEVPEIHNQQRDEARDFDASLRKIGRKK